MTSGSGLSGCGWLLLLSAAVPTLIGCGNATDGPPDPGQVSPDSPQTLDEFEQRFADGYCQNIATCCTRQGFATNDCETTLLEQMRTELQVSASNPKLHFNPDAGAACIEAFTTALSACTDRSSFLSTERTCDAIFDGTVALGGECGRSAECLTPAGGTSVCQDSVCVLARRPPDLFSARHGKLGEACASTCETTARDGSSCSGMAGVDPALGICWVDDGLTCSNGACVPVPKVGEACTSNGSCESAAHCLSNLCVADQSSGGACTQDRECLSSAICDYILKVCTPLKANGEPCESSEECQGGQCHEAHCRTWTVAEASACLGVLDE